MIELFYNLSGTSPSWYLRTIVAKDLDTDKDFTFVCDSWLAVESEDGQIEKNLKIAREEDLKQFHLVFASTVSKGLVDGHIWFSVFMRPKQSSFTRVRRLSACLALIFLVMLTNAMFFGAGDNPGSRKIVWLGNFKINFTGIIIGIQSSFIVIPPSILIVEIFRRLGPKKNKDADTGEEDEKIIISDDKQTNEYHQNEKDKKKKPFLFPNQCQYLAYFVVFASAGSSAIVCFFYSMMWGPRKSNEWLASMFAGFFQSVVVLQPIKAVVLAIVIAGILRKPVKQDSPTENANSPRKKQTKPKENENKEDEDDDDEDLAGDDGIITADEVPIIR